ncbi:Putative nucleotide-binding protein containing TIR -like domain protein [Rheinheimera sp. A13L]|uniref:TIR domain-containing protein n=1 Tax=Rheinheimera sp. A13L TaxID=506534 RepID=UPI0002125031|nr:nucleotide-binding protein [Rheinheimera sp. A13L]EGM77009.1 Putative nucleotide-binding protein containing TIR -like domain protein [Rheinheimera sp. A13L]
MVNNQKVNSLIEEAKQYTFDNNKYTVESGTYSRASIAMQAWIAECEDYILSNYGESSAPWKVYSRFERDRLDGNYRDTFDEQRNLILSALATCLRIPPKSESKSKVVEKPLGNLNQVFVVHGHNEEVKVKVARFIEKLGFEPIILHEQASSGATIIEKIEEYSNVGFGVVLYTACDTGSKAGTDLQLRPRARQNVIFEHGYLIGALARNRVCALVQGDLELPNDISGVVYTPIDHSDAWQLQLAKELKKAGYEVDMNKLI